MTRGWFRGHSDYETNKKKYTVQSCCPLYGFSPPHNCYYLLAYARLKCDEKTFADWKEVLHYQLRLLDCTIKEDKKFLLQSGAILTVFLEKKNNLIVIKKV